MKKYFLLLVLTLFVISCSKKVEVEGKISNGTPLSRIELISASGSSMLPVASIGQDSKGIYKGSFEVPTDGMYIINYEGRQSMVYLKGGENFQFTFNALTFPEGMKVIGDAQKDYDFMKDMQKFLSEYASKVNMQQLLSKDEPSFLKEIEKIKTDLNQQIEKLKEKYHPSSSLITFQKEDLDASLLGLLGQYEVNHPMMTQNPGFKVSSKFRDFEKKLVGNNDEMVKNHPVYRSYLLNKIASDYQQYTQKNLKPDSKLLNSEVFANYLDTRKDLSQTTKDYLLAYVMGQFDLKNGELDDKSENTLTKLVDTKIKEKEVQNDMKRLIFVLSGPKVGSLPVEANLIKQDGKSFDFSSIKGKPVLVTFYASWNPNIAVSTVPILKEVSNFYKSKMDFVYVNLDDSKEQFIKTSNSMLKGFPGTQVYAEGGINSKFAADWGLYGFKMPSFIILDKDGKIASKMYSNLGDRDFVTTMDKLTGLKAPEAAPQATLQNDLLAPKNTQPEQAQKAAPAPAGK